MRTLPEFQRRQAAAILESPGEVGEAVEAALLADGFNRKVETSQQSLGVVDANLNQVIAEAHAHFGTEQVREITGRQVDHFGHLVAVDVLVEVRQHVAAGVLGPIVLKVMRGMNRVAFFIDEDDFRQVFIPELGIADDRRDLLLHGGSTHSGDGVSLAKGHRMPITRTRHPVEKFRHEMCRLYDVGFLSHQNRGIRNCLVPF